jgi:hypothetical protein
MVASERLVKGVQPLSDLPVKVKQCLRKECRDAVGQVRS